MEKRNNRQDYCQQAMRRAANVVCGSNSVQLGGERGGVHIVFLLCSDEK